MSAFPFALPIESIATNEGHAVSWPELQPTEKISPTFQQQSPDPNKFLGFFTPEHKSEGLLQSEGFAGQDLFSTAGADRSDMKFAILSGFYAIHNPLAVRTFLDSRPDIQKLLFAALPKMKQSWGNDAKSSLELVEDPEDDSSSLVVRIQSKHPHPFQALDVFDKDWWLANVSASDGVLNFSVEPE